MGVQQSRKPQGGALRREPGRSVGPTAGRAGAGVRLVHLQKQHSGPAAGGGQGREGGEKGAAGAKGCGWDTGFSSK